MHTADNEAKIAAFWSKRPAELASRWANFAAISGAQAALHHGSAAAGQVPVP
jgi:hypothetical protein